jgi:hypothetical protein
VPQQRVAVIIFIAAQPNVRPEIELISPSINSLRNLLRRRSVQCRDRRSIVSHIEKAKAKKVENLDKPLIEQKNRGRSAIFPQILC